MNFSSKRTRALLSALFIIIAALCLLLLPKSGNMLTVRTDGALLYALPLTSDQFEVRFRHSVNKGLVREVYSFDDEHQRFYLSRGYFENFGAGMPDDTPESIGFGYEGDYLLLLFPEKYISTVGYFAGGEAEHTLIYNDEEYPLGTRIPRQHFDIAVGRVNLFDLLWKEIRP